MTYHTCVFYRRRCSGMCMSIDHGMGSCLLMLVLRHLKACLCRGRSTEGSREYTVVVSSSNTIIVDSPVCSDWNNNEHIMNGTGAHDKEIKGHITPLLPKRSQCKMTYCTGLGGTTSGRVYEKLLLFSWFAVFGFLFPLLPPCLDCGYGLFFWCSPP